MTEQHAATIRADEGMTLSLYQSICYCGYLYLPLSDYNVTCCILLLSDLLPLSGEQEPAQELKVSSF